MDITKINIAPKSLALRVTRKTSLDVVPQQVGQLTRGCQAARG
jgi:hypothetical protein